MTKLGFTSPIRPELEALLKASVEAVKNMSTFEYALMLHHQRKLFARHNISPEDRTYLYEKLDDIVNKIPEIYLVDELLRRNEELAKENAELKLQVARRYHP